MDSLIRKYEITPLKQVFHPKGDVYHVMKKSDVGFEGFGEAYFTTILFGEIKGWKRHTLMHMNLVVPVGRVCFYLHDQEENETSKVFLGEDNYVRLTISPGVWVAFEGLSKSQNLILNIASIEHDPSEANNVSLETFKLDSDR